ncbi:MAG TPA: VWA domain-containing protein [Thermoanaerobaculia bacterium]|nr:VWA domain-containing protein [Thermoanaerobaculia bacterium]
MVAKVLALLVVLYRPEVCERCDQFQRVTMKHPVIERRLANVPFEVRRGEDAGLALLDHRGVVRARWPFVPGTMNFEIILDSIAGVAPYFERAAKVPEADGELEIGVALARLGRIPEARAALMKAREAGSAETQKIAAEALEKLDPNVGRASARPSIDPENGRAEARPTSASVRLLPLPRQVASGTLLVRTRVSLASTARVEFSLDGRVVQRVGRPPFSAVLDFGAVPERHVVRITAFDRQGRELGRDERVVNEAGETFWLRITSPVEGPASGRVRVTMNVRTPAARRVRRVVVSYNDAQRAVLTAPPWESVVDVANVGVLRAVAELDDGRTSEDAVLLNAGGFAEDASVQLVGLPITILGATEDVTPDRITVTEGHRVRRVEAVASAAETPLTVGLLIDVSDSMHKSLPDLQEAAMQFLKTTLTERDRAFLITFDSSARLVRPATNDVELLGRDIMRIRPDGLTALHDAMVLGLLQFEGVQGRRAMIVFSDGLDRTSDYTAEDVNELARRVNIPIHVIEPEESALQHIAAATGGTAHTLESLAALPGVYAQIQAALRAQFLAFIRVDDATRENEWRGVRVNVGLHNAKVYAPQGYYASW